MIELSKDIVKVEDFIGKESSQTSREGLALAFEKHDNIMLVQLITKKNTASSIIYEYQEKQQEATKETVTFNEIPKPYAAHRYYPRVERFVLGDPSNSGTVGGWFLNKITNDANHLKNMVSTMKNAVDNSLSWAFNTQGWGAVFGNADDSNEAFNKFKGDNDPHSLFEALTLGSASKSIDKTEYTQDEKGVLKPTWTPGKDKNNATIKYNFSNRALKAYKEGEEYNKPFSGLSSLMFVSSLDKTRGGANSPIRNTLQSRQKISGDPPGTPGHEDYKEYIHSLHAMMGNVSQIKKREI
jgi:hypothetical protein